MLTVSIVRADVADAPPFNEEYVCRNERTNARIAADRVTGTPAPDQAAMSAHVEKQCRELASATKGRKGREACQRWRDQAVAEAENMRAARKANIATRDASAKTMADCVDKERQAHRARVDARIAEEERKAAEEADKRDRIEKLMNSAPTVRRALSALTCVAKGDRTAALRAIADEKKYARIGGVQNLSKTYDLQQEVAAADRRTAWLSGELRKRKTTAIKCGDPTVKQIATCISLAVEDDRCLVDEVAGALQVSRAFELGE